MFKKKLLLMLSIFLILLVVPSVFGADNDMVSIQADLNSTPLSNDIYFDSNATNDHGEGTPDSPYKELRDGRILDNSIIHLKNGEYDYTQLNSHRNISFIGQDAQKTVINGHGGTLLVNNQLKLTNITLCNLNIFNQGDLTASNAIFENSSATNANSYGDRFGGAIYCVNSNSNAYLTNCTFINNFGGYGGAIYLNGGIMEINDCVFINNTAQCYGGAIACVDNKNSNPKVSIKRSNFINDRSIDDAGGAIYLKSATFTASDLNISSCNATFGGAFALLKTNANLNGIHAFNNNAKYDGGAIYQIYSNFTLNDSNLESNQAKNGAGLFIVDADDVDLNNVSFMDNSASQTAGALYSLLNANLKVNNVTYLNNTALEHDDLYSTDNSSLIFKNDYYRLLNHEIDEYEIPNYYISQATSVKNQMNGGNCWAFAVLGALESSIIKATGESMDLSEENMKNLAALYAYYGWKMETNEGGYDDMALGYLTSWLGPVLENDDKYNALSTLSPVLDSIVHVQNLLYLKKSSYYDLDSIKKAIIDYGAVYSGIYMAAHYDSKSGKYVQCYRGSEYGDHAVALIGWDDNFQITGAPGKGAWIAKNSWGDDWGGDGYFYVSYFDNSCPRLGENDGAIAFIFNDSIKYDKNYQYDIAKTDYFFNTTSTVWYKNIFKSTDNEYLSAISTYFEKITDYTYSIYVNNDLRLTKSGTSLAGYYTFDLDELIPLTKGDTFEIVFKITVDGDAGVPISEKISLNNYFYHENISCISYDGKNWRDFFNITWSYPDHIYNSQVACIKAFTVLNPIGTTLTLAIENRSLTTADIVAHVLNQWGYPVLQGNVTFEYGDETYTVELTNGMAKIAVDIKSENLTAQFDRVGFVKSNSSVEIKSSLINTNITLSVTGAHNPINITASIVDEDNIPVMSGFVDLRFDGKNYILKVSNGSAKLENINVTPSRLNITAYYSDLFCYASSNTTKTVEITRINTKISMNITETEVNSPLNIAVCVLDEDDNPVDDGYVIFSSNGYECIENVVNGTANFIYTFFEVGGNVISASYRDEYIYNSSKCSEYIIVSKIKVNLTFSMIIDKNNAILAVNIKDCLRGFEILMDVNGQKYSDLSTEGSVIFELKNNAAGSYNYTIQLNSPIYEADNLTGQFNITYQNTQLAAYDASLYYNEDYAVKLKDESGMLIQDRDVYLTVGGKTYKKRTDDQGIAIFNIPLASGQYEAAIKFIGDDEYLESKITTTINFKSSIKFISDSYASNSNYLATLYDSNGSPLVGKEVAVVLNGVIHKLISDDKGQISLAIDLNSGKYQVKLSNAVTGEEKTQTINVIKRITKNSDLAMYYCAGKAYKVRVCDDYGKYVGGLKAVFTVNGNSYVRTTDENGYASFKIGLNPGKYTITAEYKGFKVSNAITVKSTLITKNINVKKGKTIKFSAKLLNINGKILKNKKVTFKFKGKTYKIKTNNKGIATLKITKKYKKGKYAITTGYGKLKIKNSIKIR